MQALSLSVCSQSGCPPTSVCTDFSDNPNGPGTGGQFGEISGATDGCLSGEHNSTWITITILTTGTLQFVINPVNNPDDFDFAVWGPGSGCPPSSNPIKCSWAAGGGNTGINSSLNSGPPNSEGAAGDGWVNDINVIAGETYLILVDNFTTNNGFDMSFGGTSTLDCILLPIELISFTGMNRTTENVLTWSCASELNNDRFDVEHSPDGENWITIGTVKGAGNSSAETNYNFIHNGFARGMNYYRLSQIDFDGTVVYFDIISVNNSADGPVLIKRVNMMGQEVDENCKDMHVEIYSDGSRRKVIIQ